jgi:Na+/phosphate symporter
MSMKDLNVLIKELIDKEIEQAINNVKDEIKDLVVTIDRKIEELRQYLKT